MRIRLAVAILASAIACQPRVQPVGGTAPPEAEVRARSHAVLEAEQRRDIEAVLPFYAADAVVHMENAPAIRGHAAIRQLYGQLFALPLASFDGTITSVAVARSADIAYETGVNTMVFDQGARRSTVMGKYLIVWRREGDGAWRIAALAVTNDQPLAPAAP